MKNYLAFYWDNYYPEGGMNDLIGSFDSIECAKKAIEDKFNNQHKSIHHSISGNSASIWSIKDNIEVFSV